MNKRTLIAGFIVLAIGITLGLAGAQLISSNINAYPHGIPLASRASWDFALASAIIGIIFALAGSILVIYGAILPDPPVHWDNDL